MTPQKVRIQAKLTGESADIFLSEQKRYDESQPVTLRRILKAFKKMRENGCKGE